MAEPKDPQTGTNTEETTDKKPETKNAPAPSLPPPPLSASTPALTTLPPSEEPATDPGAGHAPEAHDDESAAERKNGKGEGTVKVEMADIEKERAIELARIESETKVKLKALEVEGKKVTAEEQRPVKAVTAIRPICETIAKWSMGIALVFVFGGIVAMAVWYGRDTVFHGLGIEFSASGGSKAPPAEAPKD